jgi:integrase
MWPCPREALGPWRPEDRRYFVVALFTGLRPSEPIGLQWEAIDWVAKPPRLNVRRGVTRRGDASRPKTIPNLTRQDGSALSRQIDQAGLG